MNKNIKPFTGDFNELPLILNADDIASVMQISRAYAYEVLHSKSLPVIVLGKRRLVSRDKFFKWLETHVEKEDA